METKPQAQSFPMEGETVPLACDQSVANAKQSCQTRLPGLTIAVPMGEEGMVARVQVMAITESPAEEFKEIMEAAEGGAVPGAEELVPAYCAAQGSIMAIADPCKVMEPGAAVPMEEELASAYVQGMAEAEQCEEMEPKVAVVPKEEEGVVVVVCAPRVVIAKLCPEPCKDMKLEGVVPIEKEAGACGPTTTKQCEVVEPEMESEMEPKGAFPIEGEIAAYDMYVASAMVPLPAPEIAKLCKELDPEAVILENDVYLTIEDFSGELPLPLTAANGIGDGYGCGGDGEGGDEGKNIVKVSVNGGKVTEQGLMSESVSEPPVEDHVETEPSWGDVPDESDTVPHAVETTPRFHKRPRPVPENVEVDDVVQTMRNILMDLRNVDDARLHPDDDAKVRSLLEFHPNAQEKMGSGIDYIKIKRHSIFMDVRCFWVVRTDGTETDFSYHKCLKEKVAKDHPAFVDRYDEVYRAPKRPRRF